MTQPKLPQVETLLSDMTHQLKTLLKDRGIQNPLMVGIHTGGVWVAKALHKNLKLKDELGTLDISFYRDDFSRIGLHPQVQLSSLPFDVNDQHIILVDDVIESGRTTRAALNELFDYGRPASVILATLITLPNQELPIQANISGTILSLPKTQRIKLTGPKPLKLKRVTVKCSNS